MKRLGHGYMKEAVNRETDLRWCGVCVWLSQAASVTEEKGKNFGTGFQAEGHLVRSSCLSLALAVNMPRRQKKTRLTTIPKVRN